MDVRKFGKDRGQFASEDALYIRHEHRLHLPFDSISSAVNKTVDNVEYNVNEIFGTCVAVLARPTRLANSLFIWKTAHGRPGRIWRGYNRWK